MSIDRETMLLQPQMTLQPFDKWAINFVGPFVPRGKMGMRYINTVTKYLTRWVEAQLVKDCMATTTAKFFSRMCWQGLDVPKFSWAIGEHTFWMKWSAHSLRNSRYIINRVRPITHKKTGLLKHSIKFWRLHWQRSIMHSETTGTSTSLLCYAHTKPHTRSWQARHLFG